MKPILSQDIGWLTPPNDDAHPPAYKFFEDAVAHPFDHRARGFSAVNACWLADMSLLAYSDRVVAERELRAVGMAMHAIDVESTQAYVAYDDATVIVAFRGTQVAKPGGGTLSLTDLLAVLKDDLVDAGVRVTATKEFGRIHSGFLQAYRSAWPDISGYLDALRVAPDGSERTVWFTGHSLGGALATLAAAWFPRDAALYTYGCPRVGDAAFHDAFETASGHALGTRPAFRFVHATDIVPTVPHLVLRVLHVPTPFVHVGQTRVIDVAGNITLGAREDHAGRDAIIHTLESFASEWLSATIVRRLADHAPTYYASLLWNALLAGKRFD